MKDIDDFRKAILSKEPCPICETNSYPEFSLDAHLLRSHSRALAEFARVLDVWAEGPRRR